MRILIDTNVLIDYFCIREQFYEDARTIMSFCKNKLIESYVAAHSIVNLVYILRKVLPISDRRTVALELCKLVKIVDIDEEKIISSLENEEFTDFEDCLQDECADEIRADYIVTRDMNDFTKSKIPTITPSDFVKLMK